MRKSAPEKLVNPPKQHALRQPKQAKEYPMIGMRLPRTYSDRAKRLARVKTRGSTRKITMSDVLRTCIEQYLPVMEAKAAQLASAAVNGGEVRA